MTMAPTVERYLADRSIAHRVVHHSPTPTASETAQAAHVPGDQVAKAVVLHDGEGYLLAVLPASHHLSLELLQVWLGRSVSLATEREASDLFPDCEVGAIPPIGQAYGVDVLVDESLMDARLAGLEDVWFEGGDHQSLIRVSGERFAMLMADARKGHFSAHD